MRIQDGSSNILKIKRLCISYYVTLGGGVRYRQGGKGLEVSFRYLEKSLSDKFSKQST